MIQTCDRCGGSLKDGAESRVYGVDENGYADEEILCGRCVSPANFVLDQRQVHRDAETRLKAEGGKPAAATKLVIAGDAAHEWDGNAGIAFAECFFEYPERIQIGRIRYVESTTESGGAR
jgi:hypothetical protein